MIEQGSDEGFTTVGVLSDTHGHLYAEVKQALEGVDHIIHAGDVGSPAVLSALESIAPVTAVRGNCDYDAWAQALPVSAEVELGGVRILVGHIVSSVRSRAEVERPESARPEAVITGHTHLAAMETREGTLYLNPGSAGPRRFGRPRTVARLVISPARGSVAGLRAHLEAEIVDIEP